MSDSNKRITTVMKLWIDDSTITFAANIPGQTQTLPLALFSLTEAPDNDMAAARLAVIGVALAMIALLTSEVMARRIGRRLGRQTRYSP